MDITSLNIREILGYVAQGLLVLFVIFWFYHIIECLRRKDFGFFDKLFWTLILLVPVLGLILYRGIGNEFYKSGTGGEEGGE